MTMASAHSARLRSQRRSSRRQIQTARPIVIRPITAPVRRWECSANIEMSRSQPSGLIEPFDSGQSGKAMPALMLVVNAPRVTSTKTQTAPATAEAARAGLWVAVRVAEEVAMEREVADECGPCARANPLTIL